ncbi:hypothetical protein JQK87_13160 [Streptomyces sp. G44]|nr:hypothetical protein [Streptomyces sp. G44]MBM7169348.1 hypothetical protein [Streptomyces sp. G44]
METPDPSFRLRLLIEALTMLAAEAQTQVAWLDKHGVTFRMAEVFVAGDN